MEHNHLHGHHCECGQETKTENLAELYNLYSKIDMENLECLNEAVENSAKSVFRPWDQRLDSTKFVESDADEELLFNIPFTGNVKLKGLILIGGEGGTHPSVVRLFKNRPHMTFDDATSQPEQELNLVEDLEGTVEYATKIVKFSSVYHLTLHFPKNYGSDTSKIQFIGLKGDWSEGHRHGVTLCTYEATPSMADHKDKVLETTNLNI
ncbi:PITH domain-containing protein GA19395-like [Daphnia carinata]|uniref:PITH domain-containing protein GA19395-like n=1 Tax=Daphnia carinata TaxID=120202 RepID=UPI00257C6564|nr:PITH domain-containing protein GA19395-like [Daphnia carinata]